MKYSVAVTLAALVAYVQAKAEFTNTQADFAAISAGEDFTLTWSGAEGPVTILLKTGPSDDLTTVETITTGESGESFTWSVPTTLVSGQYAFEINDGTEPNYSVQFPLVGSGTASASSAPASTATSASATVTVTSTVAESTSTAAESSAASASETATSSAAESSATTEASSSVVTRTRTSTTAAESATGTAASVPDSKAGRLGSPVALIMTLAAMLYFH
ncbi:predicted protein [Verticillium alfalfae VaMs.102]|uniref:Predicted protein n=1 Tax=Verticillium alfalfae (strain VaMs.102 / ATCC MYA-4576 / FGSC 10136) TaxID=526221 RepID=C9SIL5_VERA1|nr:predicted protein [Verticillium alfalfae VaMs.102]EEY18788.1 predicted protein [Verticillium alfalfae VaMs.102]